MAIWVASVALSLRGLFIATGTAEGLVNYLPPVFVIVLLVGRHMNGERRPHLPELAAFALASFWVLATVAARVFGLGPGSLALAVPALVLIAAARSSVPGDPERELTTWRRAALLYLACHVCARLFFHVDFVGLRQPYSHEIAFVLALAVAACLAQRRWATLAVVMTAEVAIFFNYPAATYLLVLVAAVPVWFASRAARRTRILLLTGAAALLWFLVFRRGQALEDLIRSYLESQGKAESFAHREVFIQTSLAQIERTPLLGRMGFEVGDVQFDVNGFTLHLPPHDDYLLVALSGGLLALVLYVIIVVGSVGRGFLASPENEAVERLTRVLTVAVATLIVVQLVNPLATQVDIATVASLLVGRLLSWTASSRDPTDVPGEPVRRTDAVR